MLLKRGKKLSAAMADLEKGLMFAARYGARYSEQEFYAALSNSAGEFGGGKGVVESDEVEMAGLFEGVELKC